MNIFLQNLENILNKLEKNRSWLSKKTGIPMSTVNSWFSNDSPPKVDDAYTVGKALNIPLDNLMEDQNIPDNNNPVLNNLINFIKNQNSSALNKIEANLTMFNQMNPNTSHDSTPAFILDSEMKVKWVNKSYKHIFGDNTNFMGSNLYGLLTNGNHDANIPKLLTANTGYETGIEKPLKDGSEKIIPPFSSVLNNFILLPIFDTINKTGTPSSYAGIFCNIEQMNKDILKNIFLNFYKMLLLKDQNMNREYAGIGEYTKILATSLMGHSEYPDVNPGYIEGLSETSFLCDIGNIGIPDDILNKHGKLDEWEWKIMKDHTVSGGYILNNYPDPIAKDMALYHHEWWNGTGYPFGLSYEMIPLSARLISVCLTYNALRKKVNYQEKKDLTHDKAVEIINIEKGTHFEPFIVDRFVDLEKRFKEIYETYSNNDENLIEYEEI